MGSARAQVVRKLRTLNRGQNRNNRSDQVFAPIAAMPRPLVHARGCPGGIVRLISE